MYLLILLIIDFSLGASIKQSPLPAGLNDILTKLDLVLINVKTLDKIKVLNAVPEL
jgi:hypothetical protein